MKIANAVINGDLMYSTSATSCVASVAPKKPPTAIVVVPLSSISTTLATQSPFSLAQSCRLVGEFDSLTLSIEHTPASGIVITSPDLKPQVTKSNPGSFLLSSNHC